MHDSLWLAYEISMANSQHLSRGRAVVQLNGMAIPSEEINLSHL